MNFDFWLAGELFGTADGIFQGCFDYWLAQELTFDLALGLTVSFMHPMRYW